MRRVSLNRRLVLEDKLRLADGAGGFSTSWQDVGTFWAEVVARSGRLVSGQAGAVSVTGFRITVRGAPEGHSNRPVVGQRFRMGTRRFRIEAVHVSDPQALYLECNCEEEVAT